MTPTNVRASLEFLEELWLYMNEYLEVVPDNWREEKYASYREFARDELTKFYGWLQHIQGVDDDTN